MERSRRRHGRGSSRLEPVMGTALQYKKTMMDLQEELLRQSLHRTSSVYSQTTLAPSSSATGRVLRSLRASSLEGLVHEEDSRHCGSLLRLNSKMFGTVPTKRTNPWTLSRDSDESCHSEIERMSTRLVLNKGDCPCTFQGKECTSSQKCEPAFPVCRSEKRKHDSCMAPATAPSASHCKDEGSRVHQQDGSEDIGTNIQSESGSLVPQSEQYCIEGVGECPLCGQSIQLQSGGQKVKDYNRHQDAALQAVSEGNNCESMGNIQSTYYRMPGGIEPPLAGIWDLDSNGTAGTVPGIQVSCCGAQTCDSEKESRMENTCELLCALRDRLQNMQDVLTTFVSKPEQ